MRFPNKLLLFSMMFLFIYACKEEEDEPCITAPSGSYTFVLQSDQETGAGIGTAGEAKDQVSYAIASGNDEGYFSLDASSAELTIADAEALFSDSEEEYNLSISSNIEGCPSGEISVVITKDDFIERVEQQLTVIKDKYEIQGLGYSIILPEKSISLGLIGNRDDNVPLDKTKLWHVASNTKMVTSVLILQLVDEGKLSLTDKVSKFDINYPNLSTDFEIKHLLAHNTNYGNYTQSGTAIWPDIYGNRSKVFTLDELLNKYIPPPNNTPITGYSYNNTNFAVLGLIVEEITGLDLATAAKQRIFDPLNLKNTSLKTEGMDVKDLNGVYRYFGGQMENLNNVSVNSFLSMWGGAGAMVTTTEELAILVRNLLTSQFLSDESIAVAKTVTPASEANVGDWETGYGHGFAITKYKGYLGYGHGGNGLSKSGSLHDVDNNITITFAYNHMADADNLKRVELSTALYELALAEIGK